MNFEQSYNDVSEQTLMTLADDMAAAATSFNSHGYEVFINSREAFKRALHEVYLNNKTKSEE